MVVELKVKYQRLTMKVQVNARERQRKVVDHEDPQMGNN